MAKISPADRRLARVELRALAQRCNDKVSPAFGVDMDALYELIRRAEFKRFHSRLYWTGRD